MIRFNVQITTDNDVIIKCASKELAEEMFEQANELAEKINDIESKKVA